MLDNIRPLIEAYTKARALIISSAGIHPTVAQPIQAPEHLGAIDYLNNAMDLMIEASFDHATLVEWNKSVIAMVSQEHETQLRVQPIPKLGNGAHGIADQLRQDVLHNNGHKMTKVYYMIWREGKPMEDGQASVNMQILADYVFFKTTGSNLEQDLIDYGFVNG